MSIPFDQVHAATLAQAERLLREWFPAGKRVGQEFKIGSLAGEQGESLSINLQTGKWADFAGGPSGHDLIDLHAARFRGNRITSAQALAEELGILKPQNGPVRTPAPGDDWRPLIPPPADAPKPPAMILNRFDTLFEYTDLNDRVTHYVGRIEARNGQRKQFIPITYGALNGKLGWYHKAPLAPRPLFGLNRLIDRPDTPVILCEGEKAADAAMRMFADYICMSWFGGVGAVGLADLSPLADRDVIIWPDNDTEGHKAAASIAARLPHSRILRVDDLPPKADAADVSSDDPDTWLTERLPTHVEPEPDLRDLLSIQAWATKDVPPPDRLLGDLVTTTSRMFLVGRTGLGKTMLGFALAAGMASGAGFLHWRSSRPAMVLYLDGEMPDELIKARAIDTLRRAGADPPPQGNLVIFARDSEEDFARLYPTLPAFAPLNTEPGQTFVRGLIDALGGVDVVIFDNVMSLVAGDQKDEVPWSETLPLVQSLTARRVAQIWLDHTGHNSDRQYGSSTKAWRFDTVGIMRPLTDRQSNDQELAFTLSFEHPGKARRRTPGNRDDFADCTIRLVEDRWQSDSTNKTTSAFVRLPPTAQQFYSALVAAFGQSGTPGRVTRTQWYDQTVRAGLIEAYAPGDDYQTKDQRKARFRKSLGAIKAAGLISVEGDMIIDRRNQP